MAQAVIQMIEVCLGAAAAACLLVTVGGCSNLSYYSHAIRGHFDIMSKRQPIDKILAKGHDADLVEQLTLARDIRDFASRALDLPDNGSYRNYVDLGRNYVTWNVYAAPEFALESERWCFPIAGCVAYRGYFSQSAARAFAAEVEQRGSDVHVGGASAYSTLGWFDDPLLNTMIRRGEMNMAGVIFHELAHQQVYVQDDTPLNEAFAVAVQEEGVRRWLKQQGDDARLRAYASAVERKQDFAMLVKQTRERLQKIYAQALAPESKRAAKRRAIAQMRATYERLKTEWGGYEGYDQWFDEPINNAKLAAVSMYRDQVPAFTRLLKDCEGDFARFYAQVKRIAALPPQQRTQALNTDSGCEHTVATADNSSN